MNTASSALFGLCLLCTGIEILHARRHHPEVLSAAELGADLRCALAGFGVVALHRGGFLALYALVHARLGLSWRDVDPAIFWLVAFVAYDFIYYVDHLATHTFPFLWASHQVHHQTRAFHLLTGLRMSVVGPLLAYPFRLPLALLGVPPLVYASVDLTHALLTYFLHARFVPSLGPIGWVFNTPAHHRVHHSAMPEHFGCNYGGVLIVWDRLLGTYAPPQAVTHFGDGETIANLGPLKAHLESYRAWLMGPSRHHHPPSVAALAYPRRSVGVPAGSAQTGRAG
jgi:sterol desaturase/sphingolipid hydroxylase (fatty acid hydroxylase superfamily)